MILLPVTAFVIGYAACNSICDWLVGVLLANE